MNNTKSKYILKTLAIWFLALAPLFSAAQIGGDHVYEFLSIPLSARSAALGGAAPAINDGDISLATENPALFSAQTDGKLAFQYINYISDLNFGSISYAKDFKDIGSFSLGMQYFNGGNYTQADEFGYTYGTFSTNEMAFNISYAKSFDSIFSIGATLKPVISHLAQYKSFGIVLDIGAQYTNKKGLFTSAILFKNMGAQITSYIDETASVPFEIQAGIATKLEHAPFRFSIVAHHLETPKLTYTQTNYAEPGNVPVDYPEQEEATFLQNVMNHMIFGVEFVPSKSFFLRAGYNYNRRQELMIDSKPGATGFSWGFGFRVKKLHFSYANARYHIAGVSNQLCISTNLNDFFN